MRTDTSPLKRLTIAVRWLSTGLLLAAGLVFIGAGIGPHTGRYQLATVLTGSMRPTFAEGALVLIAPIAPEQLRVGDVLMYAIPVEDRRIVTHRVVEIVEAGNHPVVRTQGDANSQPDAWSARLDGGRVWTVRGHLPSVGYGLQVLRQPLARRVCVFAVPLVLCLVWLQDIWRRTPDTEPDADLSLTTATGLTVPA